MSIERKLLRNIWKDYNRGKWKKEIIRESQAILDSSMGMDGKGEIKFVNQKRIDKKTYTLSFQEFRNRVMNGRITFQYEYQPTSKKSSQSDRTLRFTQMSGK